MDDLDPSRRLWPIDDPGSEAAVRLRTIRGPSGSVVMLPTGRGRTAAASFLRNNAAMSLMERAGRRLAWAGTRIGILELFPTEERTVSLSGDHGEPGLDQLIKDATGLGAINLAVAFGPPRANRKPVIRVMDDHGRSVAFVKIGWNPLTRTLVEHEYETLGLPGVRAMDRVVAPRPLFSAEWRTHRVVGFEAVIGRAGKVEPDKAAFEEVALCWPREVTAIASSRFGAALKTDANNVDETLRRDAAAAIDALLEAFGTLELPLAGWHGDWTPWNCARHDSGRIVLWDWERAGEQAPVGFDSIHYRFQPLAVPERRSLRSILEISTAGLEPRIRRPLGLLYAASVSLRHLQAGTDGGPKNLSARILREIPELVKGAA